MGASIEKHGESIMFLAKTVAAEQEKTRLENRAKKERSRIESRQSDIRARINALRDNKRTMVLRMADPSIANNQAVLNVKIREVKGIEDEIADNVEELNSMIVTPKKSNRSPQS